MSAPDDNLPSIAVQKAIISANLNSTLLYIFLMGVYTGVYAVTVHIYTSSNRHSATYQKKIVISTVTALYGLLILEAGFQWYYATLIFCSQGDSRLSLFFGSAAGALSIPPTITIISIVVENLGFLLANGLMVWRCFNACGRSLLFALPLTFFIIELALIITQVVLGLLVYLRPGYATEKHDHQGLVVVGSMFGAVAATSLTATFIICRHIYTRTSQDPRSRRRYKNIVDILIQSSAIYATFSFIVTICSSLNTGDLQNDDLIIIQLVDYFEGLTSALSGLAPTLMVARLAIASDSTKSGSLAESSSLASVPSDIMPQPSDESNSAVSGMNYSHQVEEIYSAETRDRNREECV